MVSNVAILHSGFCIKLKFHIFKSLEISIYWPISGKIRKAVLDYHLELF